MMALKELTVDFVASALTSLRNLIWVIDSNTEEAANLIGKAAEKVNLPLINLKLHEEWPISLEEIFNNLKEDGGVICVRDMDDVHHYMGSIVYPAMLYYEFRRSSMSESLKIPSSWKFVMITKPGFRVPDQEIYKKFLKLVNPRRPLGVFNDSQTISS